MNDKYKILHLEDVQADAGLVERVLQTSDIIYELLVIDTEEAYVQSLDTFCPDIVLCSHTLTGFSSSQALAILNEQQLHIPFIVITPTLTDDIAVTIVKQGADDYILKDRLQRLPYAIQNLLEKYRFEKGRRQLMNDVYKNEASANQISQQLSQKLSLATKVAGIGIWEYTFKENKFIGDEVMLALYGFGSVRLTENYEYWFGRLHPDDVEAVTRVFTKAIENKESFETEFRIVWPEGSVHFIRAVAVVQTDDTGNPVRFIGTNQDITQSKLAATQMEELNNRLLLATSSAGMGIWDWHIKENKLTWDEGMCALYGFKPSDFNKIYDQWLACLHPDDRHRVNEQMQSAISGEKEYDTEFRIDLGNGCVRYIKATAIAERDSAGNTVRMVGVNQDITEKKKADLKLLLNEKRYRALIEHGADAVVILSAEMDMVYISPSVQRVLGYTEAELRQLSLFSLAHPNDVAPGIAIMEQVMASPGIPIAGHTGRMLHKDGTWRWIEATVTNLLHDPAVNGIVDNFRDVTQRKNAEQAIQESELKYRSFFESSLDGIMLTEASGKILSANPAACAMFQMTEAEICAAGRADLTDAADPRIALFVQAREKYGSAKGELTSIRKDGSRFTAELTSSLFKGPDGQIRTSLIIRDMTERKLFEDKLVSTSNALQLALNDLEKIMDSSLDIICTVDEAGNFVNVSAASEKILGYKPHELKGKKLLDFVFAEDIAKTEAQIAKIKSGVPVTSFENRYVRKDGNVVPLLWSARWDDKDKIMYRIGKDVTEKKELEKAYENERRRFDEMVLIAPSCMGMTKGPNHVFKQANKLYLKMIGKEDIIGKSVAEVLPEIVSQGFIDLVDGVYTTGKPFAANEMLIQLDKEGNGDLVDTYVNFVYQAYTDTAGKVEGIFFFANDVTEQVLSRKKIEESEKKYRQIVETAQEGIWMIDKNHLTTFANKKLGQMLGYTPEEMLGRKNTFFMDEEGKALAKQGMQSDIPGESVNIDIPLVTKDGRRVWAALAGSAFLDEEGNYSGGLAMVTNITTRKEHENQIEKISAERELLIKELTRSNKDLKEFTFITSHNFRSPLSNLIALVEMVDLSTLTQANKEIIDMFKVSTQKLNNTINDLINILIIRNNVNVDTTGNNINTLLNDVCSLLSHSLFETACIINKDLQVENLTFSKSYLESILLNLISNSIKYRSPHRRLQIDISTEQTPGGEILMVIKDNGTGIDLERHGEKIFGLYQRFHTNSDSAGLGLFMVKSQVTALGGTIKVYSQPDKGTSFHITLKNDEPFSTD